MAKFYCIMGGPDETVVRQPGFQTTVFDNAALEGKARVTRITALPGDILNDTNFLKNYDINKFSVRSIGTLEPLKEGNYTIDIESHDGFRLYINDNLAVDNWREGYSESRYKIRLSPPQTMLIRLEYFNTSGNPKLRFDIR